MEAGQEWVRLEGGGALLEEAALQLEALCQHLSAFSWRERLGRLPHLVHEVAERLPQLEAQLAALQRRAAAEGWPATDAVRQRVEAVARSRARLVSRLQRRLGRQEESSPQVLLAELEQALAAAEGPPGDGQEAWALAHRLLPRTLKPLQQAVRAAGVLQALGQRPALAAGPFPYTPEEAEELLAARAVAARSLAWVWGRLEQREASGAVGHVLRQRARHPLPQWPASGPEMLVHAAFWADFAEERLRVLVAEQVRPVQPRPQELAPLLRFLAAGARAPLCVEEGEARASLLALAQALRVGQEAGARAPADALLALAQRAEPASAEVDGLRLRQALRAALLAEGLEVGAGAGLTELMAAVLQARVDLLPLRPEALRQRQQERATPCS